MSAITNIISLNQLVENFRVFASAHQQIHTFLYGEPHEFYLSGTTNSPELWLACESVARDPNGNTTTYNMNVIVADGVKIGEVNELEVESDLIQIAEDVLAYLRDPRFKWTITNQSTITVRMEKTPKRLTTAEFQVSIKTPKPNNRCAIPFSTQPIS